jgi:DNA polymerase III delta prime subunit
MGIRAKVRDVCNILANKRKQNGFKKLERKHWRTVARDIAPSRFSFKPQHIICDNTLIKYILVGVTRHGERGLPKNLNSELLNSLMRVDVGAYTIGITTAIIKIPNAEASRAINAAEMMNVGNQHVERKSNESSYVSSDTRSDLSDIDEKAKKIHSQEEIMTGTAFIISVLAETKEDMRTAVGHITQVLGAKLVRNEIPAGKMEQVMKTALPFPYMPEWTQDDPLTKQAAILLAAQNVNTSSDDRGLRLGNVKGKDAQQITIDLDRLPAMHALIVGPTGSGKTTAVLTWLLRLHTELRFTCVFITAKSDEGTNHRYTALACGDNGTVIDIGPDEHSINPLHIVYDENYVGDSPYEWAAVVHRHVSLVTRFFAVFLEDGMSSAKRSYINETLIRLYTKHGIYVDRPETLKEALRTVKYPHMADLIEMWIQDRDAGGLGDRGKTINSMINNSFQLTRTGALSYINRDSDIDVKKKFIVIDVSKVDADMREAMNVFATGIMWQKFKTTRKSGRKTIIAIDESREFLKNPTTRTDLVNQLTQARSDNVGIWLMMQQLADAAKNDVGDEVKNNMLINISFGPGGDSSKISLVKEYYNMTDREAKEWIACGTGEAMVMVKGDKSPISVKLTDYELGVIKGTNWLKSKPENQSSAIGSCIDEKVQKLVEENGLCLSSWCIDETSDTYFAGLGWERKTFNSATGAGLVGAWVRPGLIKNDKIGSQSDDHYATVLQIAGHLLMSGITETEVHHTDDVDVSAKIGDEWIAFEFEKPRSHTKDQLMDKQRRAETDHSICYFVGVTENIPFLKDAVVKQNVLPRGTQLRRLIDNLIEERT